MKLAMKATIQTIRPGHAVKELISLLTSLKLKFKRKKTIMGDRDLIYFTAYGWRYVLTFGPSPNDHSIGHKPGFQWNVNRFSLERADTGADTLGKKFQSTDSLLDWLKSTIHMDSVHARQLPSKDLV
jgi:hypothetical protein